MKAFKIYLLGFLLLGLGACDDFLTEIPETAVPEEEAMTDLESAEQIVVGIYSCFKNSSLYSGALIQASDIQADLVYASIGYTNQYGSFYRWETTPNESVLLSVYAGLYQIIARCNFFMDNVELVRSTLRTEADKATLNKYEGDVRFMRALAYSDLIRTFCESYEPATASQKMGVPLYLHYREGNGSTVKKPRATLEESYAQVLSDLKKADELVTRVGSDAAFITEGAVDALFARVYLHMKNWEKAIEYATNVIDAKSGSYKVYSLADVNSYVSTASGVMNEYAAMWTYDSADEIIWKISFSTTDMGGSLGTLYMGITGGMYNPNYVPAKWLINAYDNYDMRYTTFFKLVTTMQGVETEVAVKFPGNPNIDGSAGNFYVNMPKVLRLSETYLIRAEAYTMMEETNKANNDLTALRKARYQGYGVATHGQDQLLEEIQEERAKELFLEGFRLHDLKRWGKGFERQPQSGTITGERYTSLKINGTDKKFVWLIPQHEITASQGLVIQNEQ
ncbi:MAG: RagB/SusD family nutrient uptake outer membrane protein [Paraprevotella sp.]|nr:RagB/SusD family nutrient uptake outer membrane protein [Paraprevotella sp.]MBQ8282842.1 RagB/SusD family nutrient uptake outer membrane protein [Paraprevotella sp.]